MLAFKSNRSSGLTNTSKQINSKVSGIRSRRASSLSIMEQLANKNRNYTTSFFKTKLKLDKTSSLDEVNCKDLSENKKENIDLKILSDYYLEQDGNSNDLICSIINSKFEKEPLNSNIDTDNSVICKELKAAFDYLSNKDKLLLACCFNTGENYEGYIISSLKLIKKINPLFSQFSYLQKLESIKNKVSDMHLDSKKPWLAIDLDETLIHSEYPVKKDGVYDLYINNGVIGVHVRPGIVRFLEYARKFFNLCLFTAAEEFYATEIVNSLGIKKYFSSFLFRDSCIQVGQIYIKDLRVFPSELPCLIVDNNIYSFCNNLQQGIIINSYYNDKEDCDLEDLIDYLNDLISSDHCWKEIISKNEMHFCLEAIMFNM